MWTRVDISDDVRIERIVKLLHENDDQSFWAGVPEIKSKMKWNLFEFHYYESDNETIIVAFYPNPRRQRLHTCIGFDGPLSPNDVASIAVPFVTSYMQSGKLDFVYGTRSKFVQNPELREFYELLFHRPDISAVVLDDMPDSQIIRLGPARP